MRDDDQPRQSSVLRFASVGDNCIDVYGPDASAVGGNALNVAVGLARSGVASSYVGEVGSDAPGQRIVTAAADIAVTVDRVHVVAGPTWFAYIAIGDGGVARVTREDPGACGPYELRAGELDALSEFDHVHLANLADRSGAIGALRASGVSTSYDYGRDWPEPGEALPRIVFGSVDGPDATETGRGLVEAACDGGAEIAIALLGAAGSLARDGRELVAQPARPIEPIDTLGAGDRYIAEFLASYLHHLPLPEAMERAAAVAAEACLHWAAWPQPPRRPDDGANER